MTIDIPFAARRVAEWSRNATGYVCTPDSSVFRDVSVLLPVLDAVAIGADADKEEKWARAMDPGLWRKIDGAETLLDPATIEYGRVDSLRRARAAIALADAEEAAEAKAGWLPISDTPPADTEGDVWSDIGDGLSCRIADCLFDGTIWIRQEVPFCDWTPAPNPMAWMPKPGAPIFDVDARVSERRFKP